MATRSCITLYNFFIYNSNFGPREGEEHKKILFFHPPDASIDTKIKAVGLCEALVKFTETFSDQPCESLHTLKTRQVFFQAEKDFWMVITVTIPRSESEKDGQPITEYHEEDVQDSVFRAVLEQSYKMFKLFMGTFTNIIEKTNLDQLIYRMDHFYSRYLGTLRLSQADIMEVENGIHFLPLDKNTYLRIQCFINLIEATFSQVKYTAFLYNDQLVWSGLEQDDMRVLYKYLTTSLFPSSLETELKESPKTGGPLPQMTSSSHYGKYVTGPPNLSDPSNCGRIPHIYVNTDSKYEELNLIVYRALSATVCLMVETSNIPGFEWYRSIDSFLGPQLSSLASDISEQYNKRTSVPSEQQYKYIYFNHMNLAQKTTIHNRKTLSAIINPEIIRLIADINADFDKTVDDVETVMKTMLDCWVVGKKSDQREFYVVINQKNANLIEINEEVKRLCSTHFNNIFFLD
ncbi:vacuolar fusion protein CCZ1 homolog [Saccoglossus kowalevskii]